MRGHIVQTDFETFGLQPEREIPVCRIGARRAAYAALAALRDGPDAFRRPQTQLPQKLVDGRGIRYGLAVRVVEYRKRKLLSLRPGCFRGLRSHMSSFLVAHQNPARILWEAAC